MYYRKGTKLQHCTVQYITEKVQNNSIVLQSIGTKVKHCITEKVQKYSIVLQSIGKKVKHCITEKVQSTELYYREGRKVQH